jgi:hypothetical protein
MKSGKWKAAIYRKATIFLSITNSSFRDYRRAVSFNGPYQKLGKRQIAESGIVNGS